VIYNGDVFTHDEISEVKKLSGASSVMIARGAMWNASIFKSDGKMIPVYDVVREYITIANRCDNVFANSKYCVMEMLKPYPAVCKAPAFQAMNRSKSYAQMLECLPDFSAMSALTDNYVCNFRKDSDYDDIDDPVRKKPELSLPLSLDGDEKSQNKQTPKPKLDKKQKGQLRKQKNLDKKRKRKRVREQEQSTKTNSAEIMDKLGEMPSPTVVSLSGPSDIKRTKT